MSELSTELTQIAEHLEAALSAQPRPRCGSADTPHLVGPSARGWARCGDCGAALFVCPPHEPDHCNPHVWGADTCPPKVTTPSGGETESGHIHPHHPRHEAIDEFGFPIRRVEFTAWWERRRAQDYCHADGGHWWHSQDAMTAWFCCVCGKSVDGMPQDGSR